MFPNVQLIVGEAGPTLVRVYPDGPDPHKSHSQIDFYLDPLAKERMAEDMPGVSDVGELLTMRMHAFAEIIQSEDYVAAASGHRGVRSGAIEAVTFGRNEPALHHYHDTYRAALGMPPLESVENESPPKSLRAV